jgi:hypothetical protein
MTTHPKLPLILLLLVVPVLGGARGCDDPPPPECVCATIYAPVCGVDGVTYGNSCEAACAEVEIAHDGECQTATYCFSDDDCACDERCNVDDCLSPCAPGEVCPAVCAGVCEPDPGPCGRGQVQCAGCDGTSFCADARHGCPLLDCPPPPPPEGCGGFAGWTCPVGFFCDFPDDSCGFADALGECRPIPDAWIEIYAPVCGCDGVTYGNEGEAYGNGVDIQHHGPCEMPPPPPPGDCRDTGCPAGSYCDLCWTDYTCIPNGAVC